MLRGDAPTWLLRELGPGFTLLVFGPAPAWAAALPLLVLAIDGHTLVDAEGQARHRYDADPGTAYLLRPDAHVCARWRHPTESDVRSALERALGRG